MGQIRDFLPKTAVGWAALLPVLMIIGTTSAFVVRTAIAHDREHGILVSNSQSNAKAVRQVTAILNSQLNQQMTKWATILEACTTGARDPESPDCKRAPFEYERAKANKEAADRAAEKSESHSGG